MTLNKSYTIKFMWLFKLDVFSNDRENDEYKHFTCVYFLNVRLIELCFRTGNHAYNNGKFRNYYIGDVRRYSLFKKCTIKFYNWIKFRIEDILYKFFPHFVNKHCNWFREVHYFGKFVDTPADHPVHVLDRRGNVLTWHEDGIECYISCDNEMYKNVLDDNYYKW